MKGLLPYLLIAGMSADSLLRSTKERDELEGIDIEKEAELIRQKKSGLSRRLREEIVRRFEKLKEEVKDESNPGR